MRKSAVNILMAGGEPLESLATGRGGRFAIGAAERLGRLSHLAHLGSARDHRR